MEERFRWKVLGWCFLWLLQKLTRSVRKIKIQPFRNPHLFWSEFPDTPKENWMQKYQCKKLKPKIICLSLNEQCHHQHHFQPARQTKEINEVNQVKLIKALYLISQAWGIHTLRTIWLVRQSNGKVCKKIDFYHSTIKRDAWNRWKKFYKWLHFYIHFDWLEFFTGFGIEAELNGAKGSINDSFYFIYFMRAFFLFILKQKSSF